MPQVFLDYVIHIIACWVIFSLLYVIVNLSLLSFLNIFNLCEDIPPCMKENVLSSVGLIAAILKIILAFSHCLKSIR